MRVKRIVIDYKIIGQICTTGKAMRVVEGLPENANFCGMNPCQEKNLFYLFYEHPSFEDIKEDTSVPELMVKFERIYENGSVKAT